MGYFDYLDNKQKKEELTISVDEHWAKVSFYVWIGAAALFVLSLVLAATVHFGKSVWFNVPNFLVIVLRLTLECILSMSFSAQGCLQVQ